MLYFENFFSFFSFLRFHYPSKRLKLFGLFGTDVPVLCSELLWYFRFGNSFFKINFHTINFLYLPQQKIPTWVAEGAFLFE